MLFFDDADGLISTRKLLCVSAFVLEASTFALLALVIYCLYNITLINYTSVLLNNSQHPCEVNGVAINRIIIHLSRLICGGTTFDIYIGSYEKINLPK